MKLVRKNVLLIAILFSHFVYSQEIEKTEKIKIGKYTYELYLKNLYNYELNFWILSYYVKRGSNEQFIAPLLSYRENTILSKGSFDIDHNSGMIICNYKNLIKDFKEDADSIKYVKKQNKRGFFDPILTIEYKNGKENVLYKK